MQIQARLWHLLFVKACAAGLHLEEQTGPSKRYSRSGGGLTAAQSSVCLLWSPKEEFSWEFLKKTLQNARH